MADSLHQLKNQHSIAKSTICANFVTYKNHSIEFSHLKVVLILCWSHSYFTFAKSISLQPSLATKWLDNVDSKLRRYILELNLGKQQI